MSQSQPTGESQGRGDQQVLTIKPTRACKGQGHPARGQHKPVLAGWKGSARAKEGRWRSCSESQPEPAGARKLARYRLREKQREGHRLASTPSSFHRATKATGCQREPVNSNTEQGNPGRPEKEPPAANRIVSSPVLAMPAEGCLVPTRNNRWQREPARPIKSSGSDLGQQGERDLDYISLPSRFSILTGSYHSTRLPHSDTTSGH